MIACWICHWGLCSSSLSGIKLAELMLEMHCYTSFHWKNTPKKKPWPSTAVKRPSTAVKRLPPLLCFLTVRQRAKGTVFEHCLQALQPSCKDTAAPASSLLQPNWHCLYSLLQKSGHLPQRSKKLIQIQMYVAFTIMCTYSYSGSTWWKKNQSYASLACLVSNALSLNPVVICQVMSMFEWEKIPLQEGVEFFPLLSLRYL